MFSPLFRVFFSFNRSSYLLSFIFIYILFMSSLLHSFIIYFCLFLFSVYSLLFSLLHFPFFLSSILFFHLFIIYFCFIVLFLFSFLFLTFIFISFIFHHTTLILFPSLMLFSPSSSKSFHSSHPKPLQYHFLIFLMLTVTSFPLSRYS